MYTKHTVTSKKNIQSSRLSKAIQFAGLLLLVFSTLLFSTLSIATVNTLVLVPETQGAAQKIYDKVIAGISSNNELNISILKIQKNAAPHWLENEINLRATELVIAVGNLSYKLSQRIETPTMIIAGGISGKPNGIPTLSLTGAPYATLKKLKHLSPNTKEVRLVYNDKYNGWWYKQALDTAKELDLKVIGYKASTLKEGVKLYEKLLTEATAKESAVWIPLRGIVPSKTILPLLLEKAWGKRLTVISNNPTHTKFGSLLAVYPNHKEMGAQLAQFSLQHYNRENAPFIIGTNSLRTAINLRTSSHLGLRFNAKDRAQFDKIFPATK